MKIMKILEELNINKVGQQKAALRQARQLFEKDSFQRKFFNILINFLDIEIKFREVIKKHDRSVIDHLDVKHVTSEEEANNWFSELYDNNNSIVRFHLESAMYSVEEVRQYVDQHPEVYTDEN